MAEATSTCAATDDARTAPRELAKRREERKKTSWVALIRLPTGEELPCLVRDASRSGLKLSVPRTFPLAKTFLLKVEERGFAFSVSLIWRRADFAGVTIDRIVRLNTSGTTAPPPGTSVIERLGD